MAKTCTNEKTAARQQWIENGLLELMQTCKFEEITVTELCRYLGLSRRSFYRYFRDIEDVLDALLNRAFQQMVITNTSLSIPEMEKVYEFWFQHKDVLGALAHSGMSSKIVQYALKYADEETLEKHLSAEDLGMGLSREMNLFIISGLCSLLISWHAEGFQKTPRQMAEIAHRMLSRSLLPQP